MSVDASPAEARLAASALAAPALRSRRRGIRSQRNPQHQAIRFGARQKVPLAVEKRMARMWVSVLV